MSHSPDRLKSGGWAWLWWVVFPPYAIYRFIRHSQLKWYVKTLILLLLTGVIVISVDLAFSPHRVEEAAAKEAVTSFAEQNFPEEQVLKVERQGRGVSLKGEKKQPVVYYRTLTDSGLYTFGLVSTDGKQLAVHHAEQLYPIRIDIKGTQNRTKAEVAIWLSQQAETVGDPQALLDSKENGRIQTVKTAKGVFEFKVGNQSVYEVNQIDKPKNLLKRNDEPVLPEAVAKYVADNEEAVGKLTRVLAYEMDAGSERYYFRTDKGDFLSESHPDGRVDLKKRNDEKE